MTTSKSRIVSLGIAVALLLSVVTAPEAIAADARTAGRATSPLATAKPVALDVTAPSTVPAGAKFRIYVKAPVSLDDTAKVEYSSDGKSWKSTSVTVPIVDGFGTAKIKPSGDTYYRVVSKKVTSAAFHINVNKQSGAALTAGSSAAAIRWGEMVWLDGYSVVNGKTGHTATIRIQQSSSKTGKYSTVATVKSRASGYFSYRLRPTEDVWYKVSVMGSSGPAATADPFFVNMIGGNETLEERRLSLSWYLGSSKTGIKKISSSDVKAAKYTGGAKSARYQEFSKGMLVEVRQASGKIRTWLVYSEFLSEYNARGKWGGKLGLPERDVRCGLPEGGCVQLFSGGSVYTNTSKMSPGRYVMYGRTNQTEILAAARSQKNYEEPSWRVNKYNTWIDGNNAWCSVFVSWSVAAAGHQGEAPVKKSFDSFLKELKASGKLKYHPKASDLRAGDVLIFSWNGGPPSHTGFATKVTGSTVHTIEGNTTDGTSSPDRGVYMRERKLSWVYAYYRPSDY